MGQDAELTKSLVDALVKMLFEMVPGGNYAKPFISPLLDKVFGNPGGDAANVERMIKAKSRSLAEYFIAVEGAGQVNPGTGYAAGTDLVGILRRSQVTARLLIDLSSTQRAFGLTSRMLVGHS